MKKFNILLLLVLLGFGISVPSAQAQITQIPTNAVKNTDSSRVAISPYAQVVPNDSYTFIGISHPSLDTAHTSIGVVVEAIGMTTVPNNAAGRAAVFTVDAGETHRVFLINQQHATINASNSSFSDARTHLITTSEAANFGNVRVTSIQVDPSATSTINRSGYCCQTTSLNRLAGLDQLHMWGVVFVPSSGAGFAMEFIGDMHDSTIAGASTTNNTAASLKQNTGFTTGAGRGLN